MRDSDESDSSSDSEKEREADRERENARRQARAERARLEKEEEEREEEERKKRAEQRAREDEEENEKERLRREARALEDKKEIERREQQKREREEARAKQMIFRTTNMFSATMPPAIEKMAQKYLRRPATIYIGERGGAAKRVTQVVEWLTSETAKRNRLIQLLQEGPEPPVLVFVATKKGAGAVAKGLSKLGYRTVELHSGRTQDQREAAIKNLKAGTVDVCVATDVAGRGLDVEGLSHVIQYDIAGTIEGYTHRIGRTGRAGLSGLATTFIGPKDDEKIFYPLRNLLIQSKMAVPKELEEHPMSKVAPGQLVDQKKMKRYKEKHGGLK